jgi:hypothetical protein
MEKPMQEESVVQEKPSSTLRPALRLVRKQAAAGGGGVPSLSIARLTTPSAVPVASASAVREVRIAPVQAQPAALHFLPAPLVDSVIGLHPGRFSGHPEDWPQWRRRWLLFLRELEQAWPSITSAQRLAMFRAALDEATVLMLDEEIETKGEVEYAVLFAEVDLANGGEDKEVLRRRMRKLKLVTNGKLTEKSWREYYAQMASMARQVGMEEEELGKLLVEAMPLHPWRRKVAQEEDKRVDHRSIVLEGLPMDTTVEEVKEMIKQETTVAPASVWKAGRRFVVVPVGDEHRTLVKAVYDRQRLEGGSIVTVTADSCDLPAKDIHNLMVRWLRMEAKMAPEKEKEIPEKRPVPRWQRDVEVDDTTEEPYIQEVEKTNVPPKKEKQAQQPRPPTPPVPAPQGKGQGQGGRGYPEQWSSSPWTSEEGKGKGGYQAEQWSSSAWQGNEGKGKGGGYQGEQWTSNATRQEEGKGKGKAKGGAKGDQGKGKSKGKGKDGKSNFSAVQEQYHE